MVDRDFISHERSGGFEVSLIGEDRVAGVREFCSVWERAVKTVGLYPPTNPLPDEFRRKFHEFLTDLLNHGDRIVLSVSDAKLGFHDSTVYERDSTEENLAFLLFRDGVCQIAFEPGVTREESDRFLAVMAEAFSSVDTRADIANRLWHESFDHIKHYTFDRIVEGTYLEMADDETLARPHEHFVGTGEEDQGREAAAPRRTTAYAGVQEERLTYVLNVFGDVGHLTPEEYARILAISDPASDGPGEEIGVDILFEILRSADSPRLIEETITVMERQFQTMAGRDRWDLVRLILENWHGAMPGAPASIQRQLKAALVRAADARHFEALADWLNNNPQADLGDVRALLEYFGTFAVAPITAMLGVLNHRPARMMVCAFLAEHGRDAVDLIGGFIYDKRWYVVRNIAKILGEIGRDRGVTFLRRSAPHPDLRVRVETVRALGKIGSPAAHRLLIEFLDDKEKDVRMRALRTIGNRRVAAAREALADLAGREALFTMDADEREEILRAYAQVGGEDAVSQLARMAGHAPWLGRRRWMPLNQAAIRALSFSPLPEARTTLEGLARSGDPETRDLANRAAERWERIQSRPREQSSDDLEEGEGTSDEAQRDSEAG